MTVRVLLTNGKKTKKQLVHYLNTELQLNETLFHIVYNSNTPLKCIL